jgi:site-specific DNA recombinase
MRCVIYCRVSIEDQSAYSLADQEARARAYADAQGWQVVRVYVDDGGSGQKVTRRAFSQMRNELAVLSIKALIVYDLDRLMRNLREQLNLMHELGRLKITLVSLSDNGIIDTSTPEGMMHFQVKGMVSEFQAKTTGRKVRDNLQFKAKNGGWVGPAPLGYRRDGGELVPSDDALLVVRIFTAYASGNHSYTSIAEELNSDGHTIASRPFGRESIRGILHNTAYIGFVSCSGVTHQGSTHR